MERPKYITTAVIVLSTLLISMQLGFAQSPYSESIYKAYSRGKMDKWYELMDACEKNINPNSLEEQLELISYYYGYTAWLIGAEKFDTAEEYIEKSEEIIDHFLDESPENATLIAYKGAYIAFSIGVSNLRAIYLGSKSIGYIDKALEIDPDNIQGNIEKGNSMFYRPLMFGGDKNEAVK